MAITDNIILDDSWSDKRDRSTTNVALIGEIIKHDVNFAVDGASNLYYYDEGTYKPDGEKAVRELYLKLLNLWNKREEWKPRKANDIIEYITIGAPSLWEKPPMYQINLNNGIYDLQEDILKPHSPDWLSTTRIPIIYDANAECPYWEQFLNEVLPVKGGVDYLMEIIGICMVPFTGMQKCIVLIGKGSNGKSKYLWGLQQAIGLSNVCNISLHTLTNPLEKFSKSGLVGKLVNVFGDLTEKKIEDAAAFKPLVGEDRIQIEFKHKNPFWYTPYAKLIFSCNKVMGSDDESEGYKRRFVHVPFIRRFKVDPDKGVEIEENLSKPTELSGLFNKLKHKIMNVMENGFTVTQEIASIIDEWCPIPDSTKVWLEAYVVEDEKGVIPMSKWYDYYCQNCTCVEPFERTKLVSYMKNLFPNIVAGKPVRYKDKVFRGYYGVTLRDKDLLKDLVESTRVEV